MEPNQPFQPNGPGVQQHPGGQYEVVPPPPPVTNDGHSGHNPYEFIMAPAVKKPPVLALGKPFLLRIGLIVGGVVVLLIIAGVVISALAPKGATPGLTAIAQRQQEIIRISDAATLHATNQDTLNFVSNVDVSITSSQHRVLSRLTSVGTKVSLKVLLLDKSTQTDTLLADAASTNTYDSAVVQNLVDQLTTYEELIQTTADQTTNRVTRQLLQDCLDGADRLLTQAKPLTAS
jgi:hypothetical protein